MLARGGFAKVARHGKERPYIRFHIEGETIEIGRFTGSHAYAWQMPVGAAFEAT